MRDEDYQYVSGDTSRAHSCAYRENRVFARGVVGSNNITKGDESDLEAALATEGPVAIAFKVVPDFRDYASGVYSSDDCAADSLSVNHAVLATGYGVEDGMPYYDVKNSWSYTWGNGGYFRILRGGGSSQQDTGMCGLAECNSFPKFAAAN